MLDRNIVSHFYKLSLSPFVTLSLLLLASCFLMNRHVLRSLVTSRSPWQQCLTHSFHSTPRHFKNNDVVNEVNRVMANPEDSQGNPVALDFSKGPKTKGYSKSYSTAYDSIFNSNGKAMTKNKSNSQPSIDDTSDT